MQLERREAEVKKVFDVFFCGYCTMDGVTGFQRQEKLSSKFLGTSLSGWVLAR